MKAPVVQSKEYVAQDSTGSPWPVVRLRDIGPLTDGDWILNEHYARSGVRLIQVGDVGAGCFIGKSSRHISMERAKELRCTMLRSGDILISRMPDPIGRACALPDLGYPTITAVDVSIWRPDPLRAHVSYLVHCLNTPDWYQRVLAQASGATRPRISRGNLEQLEIPLPPLVEQERIAARLTEQLAIVERARAAAQARLAAAEALPTAYLREVFEGPTASKWKEYRLGQLMRRHNEIIHPGDRASGEATFVGLEHREVDRTKAYLSARTNCLRIPAPLLEQSLDRRI
jgi:Type I restriction modification DNA specificity domain